jgi:hypothetical protein
MQPIQTLVVVAQCLEELGISYCVGGSFASSFYGVPRSTNDVDLVVDLRSEHVRPLVDALADDFMIDEEAVREAIASGRSFNVVHFTTLDKIDLFVVGDRPWSQRQMERRQVASLGDQAAASIFMASPEDVILSKLAWYRRGGEVSDRQWQDLLSVFVVQGDALDRAYLQNWATDLGVADLLTRAVEEAGRIDPGP